jgi:hypothetical protein
VLEVGSHSKTNILGMCEYQTFWNGPKIYFNLDSVVEFSDSGFKNFQVSAFDSHTGMQIT